MKTRLSSASSNLDSAPIDEVVNLLMPIKTAWDNIPEDVKAQANAEIIAKQ